MTHAPLYSEKHYLLEPRWRINKHGQGPKMEDWERQLDTRILLIHKIELNNAIGSSKDGPRHYHVQWSKSERKKYHQISPTGGIYQFIPMNYCTKQKKTYKLWKPTYNYKKKIREKGKVRLLHYHIHMHIYPIDNHKEHSCTENPTEHTVQSKNRHTSRYIRIRFLDT